MKWCIYVSVAKGVFMGVGSDYQRETEISLKLADLFQHQFVNGETDTKEGKYVPKLHVSERAGTHLQAPDSQSTLNTVPHFNLSYSSSIGKAQRSEVSILNLTFLKLDQPGCPWWTYV